MPTPWAADQLEGLFYRKDIGYRAVEREQNS